MSHIFQVCSSAEHSQKKNFQHNTNSDVESKILLSKRTIPFIMIKGSSVQTLGGVLKNRLFRNVDLPFFDSKIWY